jgi:hypothetical protein
MDFLKDLSPNIVASQILGAIGIVFSLSIYAGETRSRIVVCKFISDALWALNYLLVGGYTGSLLNAIGMAREAVFYHRDTKKWASNRFWLYFFAALALLSPIMEWVQLDSFSLLPILTALGSTTSVFSMYSRHTMTMRILGLLTQAFWLAYGIILHNVTWVLCGIMIVISAIIGIVREVAAKKQENK